jgi:predicted MFS family arabinose efflux permease
VIHLNVFLYALGYQIQSPLLPFLVQSLVTDSPGSSSSSFARLQSTFSFVQLIGGLLSGPLLDKFGSKALLILSNVTSALCYALTASAGSSLQLMISRVPTLFQHGVLASRGMVSEMVTEADRASQLGYIMVSYGIGAAIGPSIGGRLGVVVGLRNTAWISTALAILSSVLCFIALPSKRLISEKSTKPESTKVQSGSLVYKFIRVLENADVRTMLLRMVVVAFSSRLLQSLIPILIKDQFEGTSEDLGYLMSYSGVVMACVQGFVIKPVVAMFKPHQVILYSVCLLCISSAGFGFCTKLFEIYIALLPLLAGGALFSTVNSAQLSNSVQKGDVGTILALDMSLGSGVGIFAPDVGLFILKQFGVLGVGIICSFLYAMSAFITLVRPPSQTDKTHST